jgi:glutamine cyclotransferase
MRRNLAALLHPGFVLFAAVVVTALGGGAYLAGGGEPARRAAVPPKEALKKAEELVNDVFKEDIANANDAPQRAKLAAALLQQGDDSKDEPANRYVLYRMARDLAAQAGDAPLALAAVDKMAKVFDVPALELKAEALGKAVENLPNADAGKALTETALALIAEALDADNYDAATLLGKVADAAARKSRSVPLVSAVQKRNEEVQAVRKGFAKMQGYLDRLKKDPKDAEANFEMGRYYGLLKGKWDRAIPLLAAGEDPAYRDVAKRDLAAPEDAKLQVVLADAWWELAGKEKEPVKLHLMQRAAHWYDKAAGGLTGLSRTKATRRVEQVRAMAQGTEAVLPAGPVGLIHRLDGHTQEVRGVAFSADGRLGVSGGLDDTVRVWDLTTGKELKTIKGHTKQVWNVGFHPNGRQVFSSSWDATVRLWDIKTGEEVKRFTHPIDVNGLAVSRDGKYLLTGCDDQQMRLWEAGTGQEVRKYGGPTRFVYGVAFSNDGRHVACGSVDQSARVYDLATGQLVKTFSGHNNSVTAVAFSPDGRHLFSCGDSAAHQWDIATGKEVRRFEGSAGFVSGLALTPDGKRLLTGGDDKVLRLWDVSSGKEVHRFEGHTDSVVWVAISPDGRHALSGGIDRVVRLWGLPR